MNESDSIDRADENKPTNPNVDNDHLVPAGVGITQSIRARLNFTDDYKWKRFSARRLELIDELDLSSRKASEQDEKINLVANKLREEYGFPEDSLSDFHKLVRAGIQSVRRNRKRSYMKGNGSIHSPTPSTNHSPVLAPVHIQDFQSSDSSSRNKLHISQSSTVLNDNASVYPISNTDSPARQQDIHRIMSFHNNSVDKYKSDTDDDNILPLKRPRPIRPLSQNNDRISITSLISPSPPISSSISGSGPNSTVLPPMSSLSLSSPGIRDDLFILALERLQQFTNKLSSHMPSDSNTEYLGESIMRTAASYAVERRLPNHEISDTVRSHVLSYPITSALVQALGLHSFSLLKLTLASCCREYGFDAIIHSLSNFYYEMFNIDPTFDLTNSSSYEKMASILASTTTHSSHTTFTNPNRISHPTKSGLPSAPPSTITSLASTSGTTINSQGPPPIRPVTLRFGDQKLEFTYSPTRASSPPTVAEVIDNGRNAFSINKNQPVQIENRNHPGKILLTDADVADTFTEARIDIELRLVQRPPPPPTQTIPDRPRFQELL